MNWGVRLIKELFSVPAGVAFANAGLVASGRFAPSDAINRELRKALEIDSTKVLH